MKLIRTRSKMEDLRAPLPEPTPNLPQEERGFIHLPNTPIRETLVADNKFTTKAIWDGHHQVFQIILSLQTLLPWVNKDDHIVKINLPPLPIFEGVRCKNYKASSTEEVREVIQHVCERYKADPNSFQLRTLSGIPLEPHNTLRILGLGTLLQNWELDLVISGDPVTYDPTKFVQEQESDGTPPTAPQQNSAEADRVSLKILIPLKFPEDTPDFGGRLKAMQKVDLFANIGELMHEMCAYKFEMKDPTKYALATQEGVRLHEDRKLIHYGLGVRFSSWELKVVRKTEIPLPPLLHNPDLTWVVIPNAPINRNELSALISNLDHRIAFTDNELDVTKKELTDLKIVNETNKYTITQLRSEVEELTAKVKQAEEAAEAAATAAGVPNDEFDLAKMMRDEKASFEGELARLRQERERLESHFNKVISELEGRIKSVQEENDQLRRRVLAREAVAHLSEMRVKFSEQMSAHEHEVQRVVRQSLAERGKMLNEVESKVALLSSEKAKITAEWNKVREERHANVEEVRRESERLRRDRDDFEKQCEVRELKIKEELQAERDTLSKELTALQEERDKVAQERLTLETTVRASLEQQLSEVRTQLDAKAVELTRMREELDVRTAEVARSRAQIEKDIEEVGRSRKQVENDVQEYTHNKAQFDNDSIALRKQLTEAGNENVRLQQLLSSLESKMKDAETREADLKSRLELMTGSAGDLERLVNEIKIRHATELAKLAESHKQQQDSAEATRRQIENDKTDLLAQITKLNHQNAVDSESAARTHQQERADWEAQLQKIIQQHFTDLENTKKSHASLINEIQAKHDEEVSKLQQMFAQEKIVWGDMLSKHQQDKDTEMKRVQSQHEAQMSRWSETNQDTESRVKNLQEEILSLQKEKATEIQQLQDKHKEDKAQWDTNLASVVAKNTEALEKKEKDTSSAVTQKDAEIVRVKEHYEKVKEDLQSTISRVQKEKDEAITNMQAMFDKQKAELETQAAQTRRSHELESTNAQLLKENELREMRAAAQAKEEERKTESLAAAQKHAEEKERFEAALAQAVQKLKDEEAKWESKTTELRNQITEERAKSEGLSSELYQHKVEKAKLEDNFEASKSQQSEEKAKLESMTAIMQQYKDEKQKLEKEYQEEKVKWAGVVEEENHKFSATSAELESQKAKLVEQLESLREESEKHITSMQYANEQQLHAARDELESEREIYALQIKDLKEERDQQQMQHEEAITTLQHKHEDARGEWENNLVTVNLQHKEEKAQLKEKLKEKEGRKGKLVRNKSMGSLQQAAVLTKSNNIQLVAKRLLELEKMVTKTSSTDDLPSLLVPAKDKKKAAATTDDIGSAPSETDESDCILQILKRIETVRQSVIKDKRMRPPGPSPTSSPNSTSLLTVEPRTPRRQPSSTSLVKSPPAPKKSPTHKRSPSIPDDLGSSTGSFMLTPPATVYEEDGEDDNYIAERQPSDKLVRDYYDIKEKNKDLHGQLSFLKRQIVDLRKHHEKQVTKLQEETAWTIQHLKKSHVQECDQIKLDVEATTRAQMSIEDKEKKNQMVYY